MANWLGSSQEAVRRRDVPAFLLEMERSVTCWHPQKSREPTHFDRNLATDDPGKLGCVSQRGDHLRLPHAALFSRSCLPRNSTKPPVLPSETLSGEDRSRGAQLGEHRVREEAKPLPQALDSSFDPDDAKVKA